MMNTEPNKNLTDEVEDSCSETSKIDDVSEIKDEVTEPIVEDEEILSPLETNIAENPEDVRKKAIENLDEAERQIAEELSSSEKKLEVEDDEDEDEIILDSDVPEENNSNGSSLSIWAFLFALIALAAVLWLHTDANNEIKELNASIETLNQVVQAQNETEESVIITPADIYNNNVNAIVEVEATIVERSFFGDIEGMSSGAGFVVEADGYIITNYHIIEDASSVKIRMYNGDEYDASIVGYSPDRDLAVLKIEATGLQAVTIGTSENLNIGETVYTIGHPLSLPYSMSTGMISFTDRLISDAKGTPLYAIQLDCSLNEGNSGGPVFNGNGEVIGIANAKFAGVTIESIGFAIPIDSVMKDYNQIKEHGKVVDKPVMGIEVVTVDEVTAEMFHFVPGVYVHSIEAGSAAELAGLQVGDIIVEAEGVKVEETYNLLALLMNYSIGDKFNVVVNRAGEELSFDIILIADIEETVEETVEEVVESESSEEVIIPEVQDFGDSIPEPR